MNLTRTSSDTTLCVITHLMALFIIISAGCVGTEGADPAVGGRITGYPETVVAGEPLTINWFVVFPEDMELTHTAVHYGYFSHPEELGFDVSPNDVEYQGVVEVFPELLRERENNFKVTMVPHQKGTLFFRVHTVLDGRHYWSEERSITVE